MSATTMSKLSLRLFIILYLNMSTTMSGLLPYDIKKDTVQLLERTATESEISPEVVKNIEVSARRFEPYVSKLECTEQGSKFKRDPSVSYCNATHDGFGCWETTIVGNTLYVQCPDLSFTDKTKKADRLCFQNGTWDGQNYGPCFLLPEDEKEDDNEQKEMYRRSVELIYLIGFSISSVALFMAFFILVHFRSLRCLRNAIHCHLIAAFFLSNVGWLVLNQTIEFILKQQSSWLCELSKAINAYVSNVPYYWMFNEGLYLMLTVVLTVPTHKIRHWYFVIIGWVIPLVVTAIWVAVKSQYAPRDSDLISNPYLCWAQDTNLRHIDFILHGPVLFVLACNVFIICAIIWVLLTKLRASQTTEIRLARKAAKATLILLPLLGLTYVLLIVPPSADVIIVYQHVVAVMQVLQGIFVATFCCFLNSEVREVVTKKVISIQEARSISRELSKSKSSHYQSNPDKRELASSRFENLTSVVYNEHTGNVTSPSIDIHPKALTGVIGETAV